MPAVALDHLPAIEVDAPNVDLAAPARAVASHRQPAGPARSVHGAAPPRCRPLAWNPGAMPCAPGAGAIVAAIRVGASLTDADVRGLQFAGGGCAGGR